MIKKEINHLFYQFSYPVNANFSNDDFKIWLQNIVNFRINQDNSNNLECIWISYLNNFSWISFISFDDDIKESLFFGRFVKWKYGWQIHFYSKEWDFWDIAENTEFIGRESDKKPHEMVIKDFYYIFKFNFSSENRAIEWLISKPTLKECFSKKELEDTLRKVIEYNFCNLDNSKAKQDYGFSEILWQNQLENFSGKWFTIHYVETKKIWDIMDQLWQKIDWYDESDTVELSITINKTNASKLKWFFSKLGIKKLEPSINRPIKKIILKNDFWKIINMEEFCYNFKINWIELINDTLIGDSRDLYISKLSTFIVKELIPNL